MNAVDGCAARVQVYVGRSAVNLIPVCPSVLGSIARASIIYNQHSWLWWCAGVLMRGAGFCDSQKSWFPAVRTSHLSMIQAAYRRSLVDSTNTKKQRRMCCQVV